MAFSSNDFRDWVLLAEGGEAEVFRARQASLDRLVAVKRLKYAALVNSGAIQRFGGEAKLSASLRHPGLVQIFDYGQEGQFWCIVMEYVDGVDFGKFLHPSSDLVKLPLDVKLDLARQLVEVMVFLHGQDVVHRDLKPENIMVDRQGRVKLLDLGLARASRTMVTDPHGATLRGTLAYIAPELLRGQAVYSARSEYYALALVVMELFVQKRIFGGGTPNDVLSRIQAGPSEQDFAALPQSLREPIRRCLRQQPDDRPDSLLPFLEALRAEIEAITRERGQGLRVLDGYVLQSHRQWLWREVLRSRSAGKLDAAFALAKELVEWLPDDADAREVLLELGSRLNERPDTRALNVPLPATVPKYRYALFAAAVSIMAVFLFTLLPKMREGGLVEDLGRGLMERQRDELKSNPDGLGDGEWRTGIRSPLSRAYGVLIVEGLPRGYSFRINGSEYQGHKPIQLPEDHYVLEIRDKRKRRILSDSIAVLPGEPTVFQFEREGHSSATHP